MVFQNVGLSPKWTDTGVRVFRRRRAQVRKVAPIDSFLREIRARHRRVASWASSPGGVGILGEPR